MADNVGQPGEPPEEDQPLQPGQRRSQPGQRRPQSEEGRVRQVEANFLYHKWKALNKGCGDFVARDPAATAMLVTNTGRSSTFKISFHGLVAALSAEVRGGLQALLKGLLSDSAPIRAKAAAQLQHAPGQPDASTLLRFVDFMQAEGFLVPMLAGLAKAAIPLFLERARTGTMQPVEPTASGQDQEADVLADGGQDGLSDSDSESGNMSPRAPVPTAAAAAQPAGGGAAEVQAVEPPLATDSPLEVMVPRKARSIRTWGQFPRGKFPWVLGLDSEKPNRAGHGAPPLHAGSGVTKMRRNLKSKSITHTTHGTYHIRILSVTCCTCYSLCCLEPN